MSRFGSEVAGIVPSEDTAAVEFLAGVVGGFDLGKLLWLGIVVVGMLDLQSTDGGFDCSDPG